MSAVPNTAVVPLFTDPQGAIRVRGTRVTLDTIVTAFGAGATAEEIAQKFPTVALADVYQIIAHYLNHTAEIDAYLIKREGEAAALKREIEKRFDPVGVRARLLARRKPVHADD
jgi:uncharacterized protein (DUF433 family)